MRLSWFVLLRAAVLVALLGSSALTIDYLSPVPSFCGATSGCGKVQHSGFGYLGEAGVPLPALGLAAFTALFTLSLLPGARRRLAASVAILGGLAAVVLLVIQALVVKAFCALCVLVDGAAVLAAVAGVFILRGNGHTRPSEKASEATAARSSNPDRLRDGAWAALAALAVVGPLVWPSVRPAPDVPRELARYFVPGKINVVEFVDFQCPFCRLLHPRLKSVISEYGSRVNFVRLDLPLEMHPQARGAAKAHVCANKQKQGDAMADALFEAEDLTELGLVRAAERVGMDVAEFRRCLSSSQTERAVKKSERILRDAGMLQGLPTTFVGSTMLVGLQEEVTLRDAFDRAASGNERGIPGWLYTALFVAAASGVIWFGSRPPKAPAPKPKPS